jgi:hypothetical protein
VVAREFSPDIEGPLINDDMRGCAYFFESKSDTHTVDEFMKYLAEYSPMAKKSLPGTENGVDSIAIIFDRNIPDQGYQDLLVAQDLHYRGMTKSQVNSAMAIPIGLPVDAAAGFILGENVAADEVRLSQMRQLFPDHVFMTPSGAEIPI